MAATGAPTQTAASSPILAQRTGVPAASATPATVRTRIWIVEVGTRRRVNSQVRANATATTTVCAATLSRPETRVRPTVCSTPWLASAAPRNASGAITARACRALTAPRACGIPMQAPV